MGFFERFGYSVKYRKQFRGSYRSFGPFKTRKAALSYLNNKCDTGYCYRGVRGWMLKAVK